MKIAIADPPYIGCAHLYSDQPEFSGEIDHAQLIQRLQDEFDGWVLHATATPRSMAILAPLVEQTGARWMTWVKGFAAFKKNVSVAYAWEPVIVKAARKPVVSKRLVMRDWIQESITLKRGLTGAKPEAVCHWAFEMVGARPDDELFDLYPGTGAVTRAWKTWQGKFALPTDYVTDAKKAGNHWFFEDQLPPGYPYDAMFKFSRVVDGVRIFPGCRATALGQPELSAEAAWALVQVTAGLEGSASA